MPSPKADGLLGRLLVVVTLISTASADVKIHQGPDGSYRVKADTYTALIDAHGDWVSWVIDGVEMFSHEPLNGAPFPGNEPPTSINLRDRLLAIRNDKVMVEYQFDSTGIDIETEGASLSIQLTPEVTAFVQANGNVAPGSTRGLGDIRKVIVGKAAFGTSQPYHWAQRRFFPSILTRGGEGEAIFKVRFDAGISPDPAELVAIEALTPINWTQKLAPQYQPGETPGYTIQLLNRGHDEAKVSLVYTLGNAFVGGERTEEQAIASFTMKPGETKEETFLLPKPQPGFYWMNLELRSGDHTLQRARRAFVYAPDDFMPPLTRPVDFDAFWSEQLASLRAIPFEPEITLDEKRSTDVAAHYSIQIKGPKGNPVTLAMQAPRKPGRYPAVFGGRLSDKAENADQITLSLPHPQWPEQATYNRWAAHDDNNHLDCYLLAVRITDYLRSREDVESIFLSGASRQGPIQLVNAALDPTLIVGVDSHVPTSMGLSWREHGYRGWGRVPNPVSMADYVDPVNFAPDMKVPFVMDVGLYDGLSPAPGALAFYNYATQAPWKRVFIEPGGHGYFTSGARRDALRELNDSIQRTEDDRILRDH